mgnify:CR=1 FL=1
MKRFFKQIDSKILRKDETKSAQIWFTRNFRSAMMFLLSDLIILLMDEAFMCVISRSTLSFLSLERFHSLLLVHCYFLPRAAEDDVIIAFSKVSIRFMSASVSLRSFSKAISAAFNLVST